MPPAVSSDSAKFRQISRKTDFFIVNGLEKEYFINQ